MAGNPYTESGEKFEIPDMLANRADIYNLGDVLGASDEFFALSYLENCLTSNPVLSPLTTRDLADVYRLVRMARGESVNGGRALPRLLERSSSRRSSPCCASSSVCSDKCCWR